MLSHLLFILTFLSFQENVCPRASNTSNLQGLKLIIKFESTHPIHSSIILTRVCEMQ